MAVDEFEPFDDTELVLMDWLEMTFPDVLDVGQTGTETPADLQDHFPFVRVNLVTGNDDRITDHSVVDIDVFAASRSVAYNLAERIRAALIGYPHRVGTSVIDYVYTETKPRSLEWDEGNTRRFGAIYQIGARR